MMDADAMIYSYLTTPTIMSPNGRIHLRAMVGDHYKMNRFALDEPTPFDFMWVDRFPIWLWRDTFQSTRNHIAMKWNTTFDRAFSQFTSGTYSEFNIMSSFALHHMQPWYRIVLPDDARGIVSVGCNRCREKDIALGCCVTYGNCSGEENDFLTRYNNVAVAWGTRISAQYKRSLPAFSKNHMGRRACNEYLNGRYKPICLEP
jgi:hypothetical protein